jgi:hypothetical protein
MHQIDSIVRQTVHLQPFGMLCRMKWAPYEAAWSTFMFRRVFSCMKDAVALLEIRAYSAKPERVDTSS